MEAEYISEWPPPSLSSGAEGLGTASKRPRLCEEDGTDESGDISGSNHLIKSSSSIKADALLARWWKERTNTERESLLSAVETSTNPSTILFHVSRLSAAKDFLRRRIDYLSGLKRLGSVSESCDINISLATCYHMLGTDLSCTMAAIKCAREAKEEASMEAEGASMEAEYLGEIEWLLKLLERQRTVEERKKKENELINKLPCEQLKMPQYAQVERRAYSGLSRSEFYEAYAMTHTPVIITGAVEKMTAKPWTLDYIKEVIGHRRAPLKRVVSGSVEWARLEDAGECEVAKFIDTLDSQGKDLTYLFDWSLPLNCPELIADLTIPDYFMDNYFLRTPEGSLYHDSWPSLFVAPAGITSELHVDAFGSNFWMALFQGKKRWVFFPPEDLPFLYPTYHNSMDATFEVDLSETGSEALSRHPLLSLTHPRECVLDEGELLFGPCGCPHRVDSLTTSLAISANFVNGSNVDLVKQELQVNSLLDPRAESLLSVFQGEQFRGDNSRDLYAKS